MIDLLMVMYGLIAVAIVLIVRNAIIAWRGYQDTRAINARTGQIQALNDRIRWIEEMPHGPGRDAALKRAVEEAERLIL